MSFRWVFAQQDEDIRMSVLEQKLGVPAKIAELLAIRGIETYDDAKLFFRPTIDRIHDPFLMKDMDQEQIDLRWLSAMAKEYSFTAITMSTELQLRHVCTFS